MTTRRDVWRRQDPPGRWRPPTSRSCHNSICVVVPMSASVMTTPPPPPRLITSDCMRLGVDCAYSLTAHRRPYVCRSSCYNLLPLPRRLFFHLCLSVCLLTGYLKKLLHQNFMKFYGMVGHNPGTNRFDSKWPWLKVKVTGGQKVKSFKIVIVTTKL